MTPAPPPSPGVYRGVPEAVYHSWNALNNSSMTTLHDLSAAHLKHERENPSEPTPDMRFGTAAHSAVLLPGEFTLRYFRGEKFDKRTKEGKERAAQQDRIADGREILEAEEYDRVLACRDALMANRKIRKLLENTPETSRELSIVWIDKDTGLTCKARIDIACLHPLFGMIADLKSTRCAARDSFAKAILNYGYHRQGAWYTEGLTYHDTFLPHFVFIAFEKEPPFANALYRLDDDAMRLGAAQCKRLKIQYAECLNSGKWPAYGDHIQDIGLPEYAKRQIEMEVATL